MVMTSRQGPRDIDCVSFSVYFFAIYSTYSVSECVRLLLYDYQKSPRSPRSLRRSRRIEKIRMTYIFEIEMDAYRQEASASANPFDNSDLEEDLF